MKILRVLISFIEKKEIDLRILNQFLWIILHIFTDCEDKNSELITLYMPIFAICYDLISNDSINDNLILTSLWMLNFFFKKRQYNFNQKVIFLKVQITLISSQK